jgi:pyruvate formate lyase activating enzyme
MGSPSGTITEVRRFATHDGPGIRTTVFFKGCPLRCFWCSSPDTLRPGIELAVRPRRCRTHGACIAACPESAIRLVEGSRPEVDRGACSLCLECIPVCPSRVFGAVGRAVTLEELLREVERDRPFYGDDGGVTLSGGEPLHQPELALALLGACRARGLGTVLDTSGHAPPEVVEAAAPLADLVLLDVKHLDRAEHRRGTGVDSALLLENAHRFRRHARVRLSLPLVPGFNDTRENLEATAAFACELGAEAIDLLPLHALGLEKYRELGLAPPFEAHCGPCENEVREAQAIIEGLGVRTTVGRMM